MLQLLRKRLNKDEEGFTLIELMVVVLIIGILLAIAIPTFLGAKTRAQHRSTESNLRNALTAEKTAYTDNQAYVDSASTVTPLSSIEPSLAFQAGAPTAGTNQVQVLSSANGTGSSGQDLCMSAKSADGITYWILDNGKATYYGSTGGPTTPLPAGYTTQPTTDITCTDAVVSSAAAATTPSGGGW